jgi:hypothetical protein
MLLTPAAATLPAVDVGLLVISSEALEAQLLSAVASEVDEPSPIALHYRRLYSRYPGPDLGSRQEFASCRLPRQRATMADFDP